MNYKYSFTVFTPTFNRARTLPLIFGCNSLCKQTYRNFEWLVVDDGSTDDTLQLIRQWKKEMGFPIRYYSQKNSGKHVARNYGVAAKARGELFFTLDSDDKNTRSYVRKILASLGKY